MIAAMANIKLFVTATDPSGIASVTGIYKLASSAGSGSTLNFSPAGKDTWKSTIPPVVDGTYSIEVDVVSDTVSGDEGGFGFVQFGSGFLGGGCNGLEGCLVGAQEDVASGLSGEHFTHSEFDGGETFIRLGDLVITECLFNARTGNVDHKGDAVSDGLGVLLVKFLACRTALNEPGQIKTELLEIEEHNRGVAVAAGVEAFAKFDFLDNHLQYHAYRRCAFRFWGHDAD